MYKKLLHAAALLLLCNPMLAANDATLEVSDPWVRSAPPNVSVMAGYLKLSNHGSDAVTLDKVRSKQFHSVEVHRTVNHDGMMHMQRAEPLPIKGHQEILFEPGSYHLMLMDPHQPLKKGDSVQLTLIFNNGEKLMVEAKVQDNLSAENMEHGNHHQHH